MTLFAKSPAMGVVAAVVFDSLYRTYGTAPSPASFKPRMTPVSTRAIHKRCGDNRWDQRTAQKKQ